jgi:putative membrane protein
MDMSVLTATKAPRSFGIALVAMGVVMLVVGIIYHLQFMHGLRVERNQMAVAGILHAESHFALSFTLVTALFLLLIGIIAIVNMAFHFGPFS